MSRDRTILELEHEVGVMIRRVRRVMLERARQMHPDLQRASYLVLTYVAEFGPVRSSQVAEAFGLDKGTISRQVQQLIDLGLLERRTDPGDRRAALLTLTPEARERAAEVAGARRQVVAERLGDWSDDELEGFTSSFARYNESLADPQD